MTQNHALRQPFDLTGKRIWVAGHRGMVGAALCARLVREDCEVLTVGRDAVDLRRQADTENWMRDNAPDAVIIAAATVGGIVANDTRRAEFLFDNIMIATNIIHAAWELDVEKLLYLGATCMYPKHAPQPLREDSLFTGPLEPTNIAYATAKIAGAQLCDAYRWQYGCDFISALPTSIYGENDDFGIENGHVLPSLINKIHAATENNRDTVEIWGSGKPRREFLHVEDLADALIFLLRNYSQEGPINVGGGEEISISDLALAIAEIVGFTGGFQYDATKPDGTPRKLADNSRLEAMGWRPKTDFQTGLRHTCRWYAEHAADTAGPLGAR
jgi:GDP-L-fucose synthase